MYYHGFTSTNATADKYWTVYDDQLISLLFSKIITKTSTNGQDCEHLTDDIANNLFDLCLYINKDCRTC